MTRSESLWQWAKCVSRNMPELAGSQARLLAWWSYGIALTSICGRSTVATFLGLLCEEKVANIEQRLYEWCLDAEDKSGRQRRALELAVCQAALLRWTDLSPTACAATWYGLCSWCEQRFKCNKRGAWQWQHTGMHHPQRAARLWLALAVATLWTVAVASDLECDTALQAPDQPDWQTLLDLATTLVPARAGQPARRIRPIRPIRLLRLGRLWLLVQAIAHRPLPLPTTLQPEPWPAPPPNTIKSRRARSPHALPVTL